MLRTVQLYEISTCWLALNQTAACRSRAPCFKILRDMPALPLLLTRVEPNDPLYGTGQYCNAGPDADVTGLGVRIGLYMQCIALTLAASTGVERTLTVLPSSLMTTLVMNLILTMKGV